MSDPQVLIVGAGPTGLVLATWLARRGIRVRIVDLAAQAGTTSRALVVHARTLEFYRALGLADAVVAEGLRFAALNLWVRAEHVARVTIGDIGAGLTPFPYVVIFPQDAHERLLAQRLHESGVDVERDCTFTTCRAGPDGVQATLRHGDGREESVSAEYVAGCDGAHSTVREAMGAGFPGGTYDHVFYVADVTASGPMLDDELHIALDDSDFVAVFPLRGAGHARLVGVVRAAAQPQGRELEWSDVSHRALTRLRMSVENVQWFSTYHVHHRVAGRFRGGRLFLLGDAAHIHSPVGGQGMNTGIGDAVNLAWKLAEVLHGRADARLLDTYEPERMAFARQLVATTDRAFVFVSSDGPIARVVRTRILPSVLPPLFHRTAMRRLMFRTLSQTAIEYRASALSRGRAGYVAAGDRLPWVPGASGTSDADNFAPLAALDWQVHLYGEASPQVAERCAALGVALHAFAWDTRCQAAGLQRNALYLVRPDGHVGLADAGADAQALAPYAGDWALRFA